MAFCGVRTVKHKRLSSCIPVMEHHERSQLVANAEADLARWNIHDGADSSTFIPAWKREMDLRYTSKRKIRSDAVRVVEILCYFSPEAAAWINPPDWHKTCKAWVAGRFGGARNLLAAFTHADETTPHFHAMVIPLTHGRLSARDFIGGLPWVQARLQTQFADGVGKRFQLSRGFYGSKNRHFPPGQWRRRFTQVQQKRILSETALLAATERKVEVLTGFSCDDMLRLIDPRRESCDTACAPAQECPLAYAGKLSGMQRSDVIRWLYAIDAEKLRATLQHEALRGVEHELEHYKAMPVAEQLQLLARPCPDMWEAAASWLTVHCRIPAELVESLHQQKRLFTTAAGELAFAASPAGSPNAAPTGYFIAAVGSGGHSTAIQGRFIGDPELAFFQLGSPSRRMVVTADPIEALSYHALHGGSVLALNGNSSDCPGALSGNKAELAFALPHSLNADLLFADAQAKFPHARRIFPSDHDSFHLKLISHDASQNRRIRKSQQAVERSQRAITAALTAAAIATAQCRNSNHRRRERHAALRWQWPVAQPTIRQDDLGGGQERNTAAISLN